VKRKATARSAKRASKISRLGADIQIGYDAMHVLRVFGLESRLRAGAFYPHSSANKHWRTGEIKFDMIFGESVEGRFGAPYLLSIAAICKPRWPAPFPTPASD
jgi:6-hydroxynicotinate 3-monooxygenase